jgi:hypothetical protein
LTWRWTQAAGPSVTLQAPQSATPTFTAPLVEPGGATLVFRLLVSDGSLTSAPATVAITVRNTNDPPLCAQAQASPARLWPPNHQLVPVTLIGIRDPSGRPVTVTVTAVRQDEPLNGLGDGDTTPDAVRQGATALLRAERAGNGNGRVYQVQFTADNGQIDGRCTGTVTVCVPKSVHATCVDDGPQYDATQTCPTHHQPQRSQHDDDDDDEHPTPCGPSSSDDDDHGKGDHGKDDHGKNDHGKNDHDGHDRDKPAH